MHPDAPRTRDQTADMPDVRTTHGRLKMTVAQAASRLGISAEAVRARIQRGTLEHTKEGGKVYVLLDRPNDATERHDARYVGHTNDRHDDHPDERHDGARTNERRADAQVLAELRSHNASLRSQVDHLRGELQVRNEELRRKDHLLAAALERIPELEASAEGPGAPQSVSEAPATRNAPSGAQEPSEQRSWLYRFFFGA